MTDSNVGLDLNLNQAECIKEKTFLTESLYKNICSGAEHVVPHGTLDIIFFVFIFTLLGGIALAILGFIVALVLDF